jgi:hypothetical protein
LAVIVGIQLLFAVMKYEPQGDLFELWKKFDCFTELLTQIYIAELALTLGNCRVMLANIICWPTLSFGIIRVEFIEQPYLQLRSKV